MSEELTTPNAPGGVGNSFGSIIPETEKDRGLMREAMKRWPKRWRGLNEKTKDEMAESLRRANEAAALALTECQDPAQVVSITGAIASIVRTAVMMEGQNQTDDWNQDKNERLDAGKATERVGVMPQITLRGIPDDDDTAGNVLPVSENGDAGGNGDALPAVSDGDITGKRDTGRG